MDSITETTIATLETCVTKLETLLLNDHDLTALVNKKEMLTTISSRLKQITDKL